MKAFNGFLTASALRAVLGGDASGDGHAWPARPGRRNRLRSLHKLVWPPRGVGSSAAIALFLLTGASGFVLGGHLETFRAEHGRVVDMLARFAGFGIDEVIITGNHELSRDEVVAASGLNTLDSVLFFDAKAVREKLLGQPLIADADVRKLLPNKVVLAVTERQPFAIWQMDGVLKIVSADGTVIDDMRDNRFVRLPHVVGEGANKRAGEYAALLDAVPEIRPQVQAGILISERRWTLKLKSGVEVKLPEEDPVDALRKLALLDSTDRVLSKAIILVDLRVPGRVAFRLTEEAAAARNEMIDKKLPKGKKPA